MHESAHRAATAERAGRVSTAGRRGGVSGRRVRSWSWRWRTGPAKATASTGVAARRARARQGAIASAAFQAFDFGRKCEGGNTRLFAFMFLPCWQPPSLPQPGLAPPPGLCDLEAAAAPAPRLFNPPAHAWRRFPSLPFRNSPGLLPSPNSRNPAHRPRSTRICSPISFHPTHPLPT